jgi:starch synthase
VLNARSETVFGILNGIDIDEWDPVTDKALKQNYSTNTLHLRRANKAALAERFGLDGTEGPLFGVVSRLTEQKGLDLLAQCVGELVGLGGRLCILGSGEAYIENLFHAASKRFPGKVGFVTGYDESLSRLVQGGADVMLVPSRFEPCGLTQLYGLRYGCVPVVARVGGLADTVIHANEAALAAGVATGVQFEPGSVHHLTEALRRTVELYADKKTWSRMQRRGMKSDVSWEASAKRYADLYATLTGVERDDDPED